MSPSQEGILDSKDWDELKLGVSPEWTSNKSWSQYWRPVTSASRWKRALGRLAPSLWSTSKEKLRPTAYLDGLRGFASFLVYIHHHELWAHGTTRQNKPFENGFGYDGLYYAVAFPGIRNFFSGGHYSVATFFVMSGYVLSLKPLSLIQAGELVQLGDNLAAAIFKRWFRLFIPMIVTMLVYATTWHMFGIWVDGAAPQKNWIDEMWAFYCEFKNFSYIFNSGGEPWLSYNHHTWSIAVELRGSVIIYTTLMALSRCTRTARLWCEAGLIFYFLYIADGVYCAFFLAGLMICDLDLLAKAGDLPRFLARLEPYKTVIYYHLLAISFYLGGVPSENRNLEFVTKTRGWYYLSLLKPQAVFDYKWFYLFWASTLLVAALPRISWLKRFMETRFCQYMGHISYAFYLVHGPILAVIGDRLYLAVGWQTEKHLEHIPHWANKISLPKSGPMGLEVAFLIPHLILFPLTIVVADAVTKSIDAPSVKFAAWLHRKTLAGSTAVVAGEGLKRNT